MKKISKIFVGWGLVIVAVVFASASCSSSTGITAVPTLAERMSAQPVFSTCLEAREYARVNPLFPAILSDGLSAELQILVDNAEGHRTQVLVGEKIELQDGDPCLVQHEFRVDAEYFYPASAIKTMASIAVLQFLNGQSADELAHRPVGLDDVLWFHRRDEESDAEDNVVPVAEDPLRRIIEETQIISSNWGFNQLFDFAGHENLNQSMWEAGLKSVRMQHRFFSKESTEAQKRSPEISIEGGDEELVTVISERKSNLELEPIPVGGLMVGSAHYDFVTGDFRAEAMDFSTKNYVSVGDLQALMLALFEPGLQTDDGVVFPGLEPYHDFLTTTMGRDPTSFGADLGDNVEQRFRPLMSGLSRAIDREDIGYYGKGGRAYGFHLENAYLENRSSGRGLFVTAVVYVNENEVLNDNEYEYDELGFPFFDELGEILGRAFLDGSAR